MKKEIKKSKNGGITLVALVITIIILIILAGITLNLTFGKHGIFTASEKGTTEYNKQEATEKINLKITNTQIHIYAENKRLPTLQEFADELCEDNDIEYVKLKEQKLASLEKIEIGDSKSIFTKLKEYPYEFEINSSLQLASIDGIRIADTVDNSKELQELRELIEQQNSKINELNKELQALKQKSDEVIVSKFTSDKINGDRNYIRQNGKVVSIMVDGLSGSQNIKANEMIKVAGGLPKCAEGAQELTIKLDNPSYYARCWIDSNGSLMIWTSANGYTGNILIGGTYICQ